MILSLKDWIARFEKKTGEKFELPPEFRVWWLPDRGFGQIRFYKGDLYPEGAAIVYQVCGDIQFWYDMAQLICLENQGHVVTTICIVPILPYLRLLHFTIKEEYTKDGCKRYICADKYGRKVIATFKDTDEKGQDSYYVTMYLDQLYEEEANG